MKDFKKKLMTFGMLALLAAPIAGNVLPKEPAVPEDGVSACSLPPYGTIFDGEDDDIEVYP